MQLWQSEIIHLSASLIIFWVIARRTSVNYIWPLIGALLGGFLIDVDHVFDQLIVFGFNLDPDKLLSGGSFVYSDKAYILFHGWEFVILLLIIYFYLNKIKKLIKFKTLLLALTISMFAHLIIDSNTNHMSYNAYSLIYRIGHKFDLQQLITPDHWLEHLEDKQLLGLT